MSLATSQSSTEPPVELLPTHSAAAKNDVNELARLVREHSTLTASDTKETPLHAAARAGSKDALRWLLENTTTSPLDKATNGNTAAHYAAVYGHLGALKLLICYKRQLSNQIASETDENGLSILSLATLQGDEEMVSWIVDNFPRLIELSNSNGNLAIHFAAASGFLKILKLLIRKCGRELAEKQDNHLTKPVFFASQEGKLEVLDYLVNELGVDPVARDKSGMSSVHAATQGGQPSTVKWLISKLGPQYILDKTIDGATPLHMAAALGHCEILYFLLESLEDGSDIDILDHIHATPAHDAAEYGQTEAMILLLKHGANVNIKDTESKTPYELAVEQNHSEVASMIADYRENGPSVLSKYEKKIRSQRDQRKDRPRTAKDEAEELSSAIQQTTVMLDERRSQNLRRQESLERGLERTREPEYQRKAGSRRPKGHGSNEDEEDIEHTFGPQGDIYARPKKRKHRKGGSHQNIDLDDFMSETMSHHSFSSNKGHTSHLDAVFPLDDSRFNPETVSNYSRPSRVKRYQDSDSEISSFSSSYQGRHNVPGFYRGGPYDHLSPHPLVQHVRGPRSTASGASRHSSQGGRSRHRGYPVPPHLAYPYGYHPAMLAAYYPYGPYGHGYRPRTTEERMHLAALQRHRPPPMPAFYHPGMYMQQGRRSVLAKQKETSKLGQAKPYADKDIGYGPPAVGVSAAKGGSSGKAEDIVDFHPPAPPITRRDGSVEAGHDVVRFDSNFYVAKKTDAGDVRQVGDTTLNPAKTYDGRYDKYIMTDSEDEPELDEHINVSHAAECAAIIAIGCVAGLRGLGKIRKGKSSIADLSQDNKSHLSNPWEAELDPRRAMKGSISGLDDPELRKMSPTEFAAQEELERQTWKNEGGRHGYSSSEDHLDRDIHREGYASVSKQLGEKILSDSLGARNNSMLNIPGSTVVSKVSLNQSSEEEIDGDFGDAITLVHGTKPSEQKKVVKSKLEQSASLDPEEGKKKKEKKPKKEKEKKEKEKKEKEKKEKEKEKKDKKEKKSKESKRKAKETKEMTDVKPDQSAAIKSTKPHTASSPPPKETGSPGKGRKMVVHASPPKKRKEPEHYLRASDAPMSTSTPLFTSTRAGRGESPTKLNEKVVSTRQREHVTSVSVPVNASVRPAKTGPREVNNRFFDDESDEEQPIMMEAPESSEDLAELDDAMKLLTDETDDLTKLVSDTSVTNGVFQRSEDVDLIELDEASKDIFGEDGLAELNDALRQLSNIQAVYIAPTRALETPTVTHIDEVEDTGPAKKMNGRYSPAIVMSNGRHSPAIIVTGSISSSSDEQLSYEFSKGVKEEKKSEMETREIKIAFQDRETLSLEPPVTTAAAGNQAEGLLQPPGSPTFQRHVMAKLNDVTETLKQMMANPTITQTEIHAQQEIQQQLIQNVLTNCQNDPQLTARLLAILKETQSSESNGVTSNIEQKLLEAQERQLRETQQHFQTQAEFQQHLKQKMDEQAQQQLQGIQAMHEEYTKRLEQQMVEQRKTWEEEMRRREEERSHHEKDKKKHKSKDKKHKKRRSRKRTSDSDSSDSDSDELQSPAKVASKPPVKTMEAKIYQQELWNPHDLLGGAGTKKAVGKKVELTPVALSHTTDALQRFEGGQDEEEEEDDMLQYQRPKPATLRHADIIKLQALEDYTPHRAREGHHAAAMPQGTSAGQKYDQFHLIKRRPPKYINDEEEEERYDEKKLKFGQSHVYPNEHKKNVKRDDPMIAGADGELAAALRIRQKQIQRKY